MSGKYLCVNLHFIWSTKSRKRLVDPLWCHRLHSYLGSIALAKNSRIIEVNTQPDHIHLYASMPSTMSIAYYVNALKANSTRWIHETIRNRKWFSWQAGYAAFSVSKSAEKGVIEYIRNQQEHHKRRSFEEELVEFLNRHQIEYDPRYIFD
jgi:REP element-mobilizing transposase RayT